VTRTHGLNGEVSVVFDTEASLAVREGLLVWFVPPPGQVRSARIVQTRPGPKGTLVYFHDVTTVDQASRLVGCSLLARVEDLPEEWEEADGSDHTGFSVYDKGRGELGVIRETILTGANDVWIVDGTFGEVLIPVIDDVVLEIDEQERTIRVALLPGLLADDDR
jgi:16S rRNA processing protein RimM